VSDLFTEIPGQEGAIEALRASVESPVHAYLFEGPPGSGKRHAARSFAAGLLCKDGGCGTCTHCVRALSGIHPDLVIAERDGATYRVDDIHALTSLAQRRPLEASHTVIVIPDAHLLGRNAAAFLKTLEEPPPTTVFILLADDLPKEMMTIRSRCVEILFEPLNTSTITEWLVAQGIAPDKAAVLAEGAAGDAHRALLLAEDPGFASRLELWREVPSLLDGTGATAAELAFRLNDSLKEAIGPLVAAHAAELVTLEEQAKAMGERGLPRRKEITDRHKREERRYQTTELRAGLGVLSRQYRESMATALTQHGPEAAEAARASAEAIDAIGALAASLSRNPRLPLGLEHLFLTISH